METEMRLGKMVCTILVVWFVAWTPYAVMSFWAMLFDLKHGAIKDFAKYVVSLDQLHSFMCFAIIKSAVFAICSFTRFSLTMYSYSFQNRNRITKIKTLFV